MADQYTPPNEKVSQDKRPLDRDTEAAIPSGRAGWFGGQNVAIGPRIGPVLSSISLGESSDTDDSSSAILHKQKALEDGHAIQYRTCSWQKVCHYLCELRTISMF